MKKEMIVITAAALLCGCSTSSAESRSSASDTSESSTAVSTDANAYSSYSDACTNKKTPDSYYAAVNSTYTMSFSDDTQEMFVMDGTLEASSVANSPTAHSTQHISSNGTDSDLEGWYYGGRFYNTYNNVNYYEDMAFSDLKSSLLVPMDVYQVSEGDVTSVTSQTNADGTVVYTVTMDNSAAADLFSSRYDSYGLSSYDGYSVTANTIKDTFDADGYFIKEEANFTCSVTYKSQNIGIEYSSYVSYLKPDATTVTVSDEQKTANSSYVNYADVDTSTITTESLIDDTAEATVTDTFKKRLVGRLDYTDNGDGTYTSSFNTSQTYTIDFNTKTFKYTNYSIAYTYSWQGDTGSMGACTLIFETEASSDGCEDTTLSSIKDAKTYLEMELFYCGLSLDDLMAEANQ